MLVSAPEESSAQNAVKSGSEVLIEDGVDNGVERTVAISQPPKYRKDDLRGGAGRVRDKRLFQTIMIGG